jgi:hypothetical protein
MTYVEKQLENARSVQATVWRVMDEYWTPFGGHKVSFRSSKEKWNDFLLVAQSGQRTAASEEEKMVFFKLECQVASQLQDWAAKREHA